jgi:dihydroneopterin aldolase
VDTIVLADMAFYARHGARAEEQALGQRFQVDLEVDLDLRRAGQTDDLADTVDYGALYRAVRAAFEAPRSRLLEAVAQRVATAALAADPRIQAARVEVRKPAAPIDGAILAHAAVRVARRRDEP